MSSTGGTGVAVVVGDCEGVGDGGRGAVREGEGVAADVAEGGGSSGSMTSSGEVEGGSIANRLPTGSEATTLSISRLVGRWRSSTAMDEGAAGGQGSIVGHGRRSDDDAQPIDPVRLAGAPGGAGLLAARDQIAREGLARRARRIVVAGGQAIADGRLDGAARSPLEAHRAAIEEDVGLDTADGSVS